MPLAAQAFGLERGASSGDGIADDHEVSVAEAVASVRAGDNPLLEPVLLSHRCVPASRNLFLAGFPLTASVAQLGTKFTQLNHVTQASAQPLRSHFAIRFFTLLSRHG